MLYCNGELCRCQTACGWEYLPPPWQETRRASTGTTDAPTAEQKAPPGSTEIGLT